MQHSDVLTRLLSAAHNRCIMKKTLLILALLPGCCPAPAPVPPAPVEEIRTGKCEFRPGDEIKVVGKFYLTDLDIKRKQPKCTLPEPVKALFYREGKGYHHEVRIMEGEFLGWIGYIHESDFR